jgi:hypothetical protein
MRHILNSINSVNLKLNCIEIYKRFICIIALNKNANFLIRTLYTELTSDVDKYYKGSELFALQNSKTT